MNYEEDAQARQQLCGEMASGRNPLSGVWMRVIETVWKDNPNTAEGQPKRIPKTETFGKWELF